ncbi:MAG: tetratricopeptide repeat protein [Candidatus Omnitrophica bacterium]|nr:tetratricopeptide repeat protein [Candidatus Omnitrophota bacterium]
MEIRLIGELNKFDLPFSQIQSSLKEKLKNGDDPCKLIQIKTEERDKILNWFRNTSEWGRNAYEKYKKLFIDTSKQMYFGLEMKATATSAAPWALSWVQYNIGECYEYLGEFDSAIEEYKKGFSLWVQVGGWNGNGPIFDLFKRALIILSKLKDKDRFKEYESWLLSLLEKCPKDTNNFYNERVIKELKERMQKL